MEANRTIQILQLPEKLAPVLMMGAIIVVWEVICHIFLIPEFLLPSPSAIVRAAADSPSAHWLANVSSTLLVAIAGYLAAIVVGIPLAVMLALSPLLSRTVFPMLVVIHSTPIVAIAPIIVVTLGVGVLPRVVITFLISFFPIIISTATGIIETPEELLEMSRALKAPRRREIFQIRLPSAVPHIFSGLKVSITLSVIGAVVAEFVASESGLGYAILFATSSFTVSTAFANLVALVILSLVLFRIVSAVQSLFFDWSLGSQRET
jgi:NitT/TauT family transport system permease protein